MTTDTNGAYSWTDLWTFGGVNNNIISDGPTPTNGGSVYYGVVINNGASSNTNNFLYTVIPGLTGNQLLATDASGNIYWATQSSIIPSSTPTTIQIAYNNSATASNVPILTLNNSYRGFDIRDSSTPMSNVNGNLFGVFNNAGTVNYFSVTANNLFGLGATTSGVTGTNNFVSGSGAQVTSGSRNFVYGNNSLVTTQSDCVIIGTSCESTKNSQNVVIGYTNKDSVNSNSGGANCVIIGSNISRGLGTNAILIGNGATNYNSTALTTDMTGSIAIGNSSQAIAQNAIAIGTSATASDNASGFYESPIAIGYFANAAGKGSIAIGENSTATNGSEFPLDGDNVAIGGGCQVNGNFSVAVGGSNVIKDNDKGMIVSFGSVIHAGADFGGNFASLFSVTEPNAARAMVVGGFEVSNEIPQSIICQGLFMVKRDSSAEGLHTYPNGDKGDRFYTHVDTGIAPNNFTATGS